MAGLTDVTVKLDKKKVYDTLIPAFVNDPLLKWMLDDGKQYNDRRRRIWWEGMITMSYNNKSLFYMADDWSGAMIWLEVDAFLGMVHWDLIKVFLMFGFKGLHKMLIQYEGKAKKAHKKFLTDKNYHYTFFVGVHPDHQGKGVSKKLLKEKIDLLAAKAKETGKEEKVWLESTTEKSRDIYAGWGFKLLGSTKFGEGKFDNNGEAKKDGEGVTIWYMLWKSSDLSPAKSDDVAALRI